MYAVKAERGRSEGVVRADTQRERVLAFRVVGRNCVVALRRIKHMHSFGIGIDVVGRWGVAILFVVTFIFIVLLGGVVEQLVSIHGPLVRTDDELAQEFVAQAVEVLAVKLRLRALLEVLLCCKG